MTFPFSPCPTSERKRKLVHDTPSIYYNKPVVSLPLKFPISVLTHTHTHVRVYVLVLKWETLEVNSLLAYCNKLRACRELVFSHSDVGQGLKGNVAFMKGVSGFTTKSLISSLFMHRFSPIKK